MTKQKTSHHVLVAGAAVLAIVLVVEGYLLARAFVTEVRTSSREIAQLQHEVQTLQVMLDSGPRPNALLTTQAVPAPALQPMPDPMVAMPLPPGVPHQPPHTTAPRAGKQAALDDPQDEGAVVLLADPKTAPATAGKAQPTAPAVQLLTDRK